MKLYLTPDNLVVNTSFDHDILNAGFDWYYSALPGVALMLDSTQAHRGNDRVETTFTAAADVMLAASIFTQIPRNANSGSILNR